MRRSTKRYLEFQSEFSHRYACWASNHRGWAKMKKKNRRLAKRKMQREINKIKSKYMR